MARRPADRKPRSSSLLAAPSAGTFLQLLRQRLDLTQDQFLAVTGLPMKRSMLTQIERGSKRLKISHAELIVRRIKMNDEEQQCLLSLAAQAAPAAAGRSSRTDPLGQALNRLVRQMRDLTAGQSAKLLANLENLLSGFDTGPLSEDLCAIIPVAGWQSELLSDEYTARLVIPCIDEAIQCSITRFLLVVGENQHLVKDLLAEHCHRRHRRREVEIKQIAQRQPLGLGDAVRCAMNVRPRRAAYALMLPDDHFHPGCLRQMLAISRESKSTVLALTKNRGRRDPSGVAFGKQAGRTVSIHYLQEKPPEMPGRSNPFFVLGRYVLLPDILPVLERLPLNKKTERLELTDGLNTLAKTSRVQGVEYQGEVKSISSYRRLIMQEIDAMFTARPKAPSSR